MIKYLAILCMLIASSSADAAWRVGPRSSVQIRIVRRPAAARVVHRPAFAAPIQQGGCRMVNGRLVCPNNGSVRGWIRVR